MLRNRPQVAIFVFSLLQMIAPISWWCTPPGGGLCSLRQASTYCLLICSEKLPFCKSTIWIVAARAACFYSYSYSFPLWESLPLKIFILFFPPPTSSFNQLFVKRTIFRTFLFSLCLYSSLRLSLLCGLLWLPLQTLAYRCLIWVILWVELHPTSPVFFLVVVVRGWGATSIISATKATWVVLLSLC